LVNWIVRQFGSSSSERIETALRGSVWYNAIYHLNHSPFELLKIDVEDIVKCVQQAVSYC
jgi:hypothetical protein